MQKNLFFCVLGAGLCISSLLSFTHANLMVRFISALPSIFFVSAAQKIAVFRIELELSSEWPYLAILFGTLFL
jgi:hypothetical protein